MITGLYKGVLDFRVRKTFSIILYWKDRITKWDLDIFDKSKSDAKSVPSGSSIRKESILGFLYVSQCFEELSSFE